MFKATSCPWSSFFKLKIMSKEPRRANRGNRYHNEKSEGITPNKLLEAKKERERIREENRNKNI